MKDVMNTLNQVTDGLKESTGVDLNAVLSGFLKNNDVADAPAPAKAATTDANGEPDFM